MHVRRPLLLFLNALILTSVTVAHPLGASVVQPGDGPYYGVRRGRTQYIYSSDAREFIDQLAAYHEAYRKLYDQSFNWQLDEEQALVLTSPAQQVANAYATTTPNIESVWFPSGAGMLEEMAESSWLLTLDSHETSHLYQLNSKGRLAEALKPVFGNALFIYPAIWPVFLLPNIFLPTSMLEGNAVLNESRVNQGGRLHSGEKRALVLAQIAAGDSDATRLINDEFKFPFGENAYLQGGYFQAHLAAKYGIDKTNGFFRAHGGHFLWPLILNKTFRDHFGSSFYQEVHEYLHELQPLAVRQQQTPGLAIAESVFNGPLNHDDRRVWWISTTGTQSPELYIYDKSLQSLDHRRLDIPVGKIFFDGDQALSAASVQHDLHHITYSLYGEGASFNERFRGQIVTDRRAGKTVALDARNSWLDPHVLLDGEMYDVGHSNPILDDQGNVYYFRQNGIERLLYRNRELVFKYDGYYGKLCEIGDDGAVYFIANTDYGSSLYRYRTGEIRRLLSSDRVIDARRVREGEFLVTEVQSRGHRTVLATASETAQTPVNYRYAFTTENVIAEPAAGADQTQGEERSYNSWRSLRYSALNLTSNYSFKAGLGASLDATWTDPLQYQQINLGYAAGSHWQLGKVGYTFTKYLPQFFVNYWWRQDHWTALDGSLQRSYDQQVSSGVLLPLWRWRRWNASVTLAADYRRQDTHRDPTVTYVPPKGREEEVWGTINGFNLSWSVPASLAFYDWRRFDLSYLNRLDTQPDTWRKLHNTSLAAAKLTYGLPLQFFVTGFAGYAWGEDRAVDVKYNQYALLDSIEVTRLTPHGDYRVKNAGVARLEVAKAFVTPAYWARFPIGLNRVAPLVVAQGIAMDAPGDGSNPPSLFEWGYGADLEILFIHRLPMRLRLINAFDTREPNYRSTEVTLNYVGRF